MSPAATLPVKFPLSPSEMALGAALADEPLPPRPRCRADCVDGPRPCPWVGCRHHLASNVSRDGTLQLPWGDDPDDWPETCALDVAERGGMTLEECGELLDVTRERIRQIEAKALEKAKKHLARRGVTEFEPFGPGALPMLAVAQERAEETYGIGPVSLPASVPRQPSPHLYKEEAIMQKSKLEQLPATGARLVKRAVESEGAISPARLYDQLVAQGYQDKLPTRTAVRQYLQRKWAKQRGTAVLNAITSPAPEPTTALVVAPSRVLSELAEEQATTDSGGLRARLARLESELRSLTPTLEALRLLLE